MSPLLKKDSFDSSKCVSLLELTLKRIKILRSKKVIIAKQCRDDVAKILQRGQDANALARVEYAFREDNIAGAYDLLEKYCQLIIKRTSAIKSQQECPSELKEAIASLIYAGPRCGDLQELQKLRDILTLKYGAEYITAVLELRPECAVNQQIVEKLSSRPPNSDTRLKILKEIAVEYKIDWNYQQAAASLKNGDTSAQDKQKGSTSPSRVSKGAASSDAGNSKPPTPVSMYQKEPANLAAHDNLPSKPKNTDLPRANRASDVAQKPTAAVEIPKPTFDSTHPDDARHKSHAVQNASPSIAAHSGSPKPREFEGASKKPIPGATTISNKETPGVTVHRVSSQEKESLPAAKDAALSATHGAASRQKDFMDASDAGLRAGAHKQKSSSIHVRHDELKGQPSIINPPPISNPSYETKGVVSPNYMGMPGYVNQVKPASVGTRQDGHMEKAKPVLSSTDGNQELRPEAFVNPIQVPYLTAQRSSERKSNLDNLKGQASSTQDIYQARVFSSRSRPHSFVDHDKDGSPESLAAKQYMRAHKSYVKAETGAEEEDQRSMDNSGLSSRPKHATHSSQADPYARLRQEGKMDYRNVSPSYEQVQERKRMPAMDREEDTSALEYYAREQPKGTHYQRASKASGHEGSSFSKEKEWEGKNAFSPQGRHQAEESSFSYHSRNPSTSQQHSKGYATKPLAHSEMEDHDLADLEAATESAFASAARAAEAARAAIDMVRTTSMRSRANGKVSDAKDAQREAYSKPGFNSSRRDGRSSADGTMQGADAIEDRYERKHYKHPSTRMEASRVKAAVQISPRQEQEPDLCDSEIPQFDDYSSYESSEEEAPRGRAATTRKDGGMGTHHQMQQTGRLSTAYGDVDNAARRWGASIPEGSNRDLSKQRWKLTANEGVDAHPQSQAHTLRASQHDYPAIAAQDSQAEAGRYFGVSRRSVRSSRPT